MIKGIGIFFFDFCFCWLNIFNVLGYVVWKIFVRIGILFVVVEFSIDECCIVLFGIFFLLDVD